MFITSSAHAEAIHYDQIPADASAYFHVDIDRFLTSHIFQQMSAIKNPDPEMEMDKVFGGHVSSLAACAVQREGPAEIIFLLHGESKVRQKLELRAAGAKDVVVIRYENQEIYYSSAAVATSALGFPADIHTASRLAPNAETPNKSVISLGMGDAGTKTLTDGPSYIAFVGQDLVVATTDLSIMAEALDVIAGRKPSLAKQDPQGLKVAVAPGTIAVMAGFKGHATINPDDLRDEPSNRETRSATQPTKPVESSRAFDLDLFGSLKGKARFAQMDIGENEQSFFANASIMMTDTESAEQLKNLIVGVKALISLSQENKKPLLDPLEIQSAEKSVQLHWAWPTANLSELFRLGRGDHDDSLPATAPAKK